MTNMDAGVAVVVAVVVVCEGGMWWDLWCACGRWVGGGGGDRVGILVRGPVMVVVGSWSGMRVGEVLCVGWWSGAAHGRLCGLMDRAPSA